MENSEPSGTDALVLEAADQTLDLTGLAPEQSGELRNRLAQTMAAARGRQAELNLSLQGLGAKLDGMTGTVSQGTAAGLDMTVRNVTEDVSGRTEILLGNSARARRGGMFALPSRKLVLAVAAVIALFFAFGAARTLWLASHVPAAVERKARLI